MFCKNCGAQIDDNSVFCASCGEKVSEAQPKQEITPAPASAVTYSASADEPLPKTKCVYGTVLESTAKIGEKLRAVKIVTAVILIWAYFRLLPGDTHVVVLIFALVIAIMAWRIVADVYSTVKFISINNENYSSFTDETASVKILPCIFPKLSAVGIVVRPHEGAKNSVIVEYAGSKYKLDFFSEPGGYFNISYAGNSKERKILSRACADIPIIVYYVQDALKKAVVQ